MNLYFNLLQYADLFAQLLVVLQLESDDSIDNDYLISQVSWRPQSQICWMSIIFMFQRLVAREGKEFFVQAL